MEGKNSADTDNSAGDMPESVSVREASENNGPGEEEPMPPVDGEEEESEESDSDAEDDSDLFGEASDDDESSEDIYDGDDEEEPLSPMTVEEEMNHEPEEITMEIPVDEGITDSDGKGDAEAAEPQERVESTKDVHTITELIKPVSYAETFVNDRQDDVSITFLANRSDGKEILVDNKFLKINNPLLLIDFYEQILRFINPSK
ncbi:putative chromo domain-containing protein LHP1 [Capsicum baccatum]|uniref:Chromo domain-containing protein LHP1 n=1 Tax=Capsicum baccatum TaxID=33114 RepID=A0A2G2XSU7_CAPBA|nr:putative chromo domain-containing protein LHP1 [Capsicum baccatum]